MKSVYEPLSRGESASRDVFRMRCAWDSCCHRAGTPGSGRPSASRATRSARDSRHQSPATTVIEHMSPAKNHHNNYLTYYPNTECQWLMIANYETTRTLHASTTTYIKNTNPENTTLRTQPPWIHVWEKWFIREDGMHLARLRRDRHPALFSYRKRFDNRDLLGLLVITHNTT